MPTLCCVTCTATQYKFTVDFFGSVRFGLPGQGSRSRPPRPQRRAHGVGRESSAGVVWPVGMTDRQSVARGSLLYRISRGIRFEEETHSDS